MKTIPTESNTNFSVSLHSIDGGWIDKYDGTYYRPENIFFQTKQDLDRNILIQNSKGQYRLLAYIELGVRWGSYISDDDPKEISSTDGSNIEICAKLEARFITAYEFDSPITSDEIIEFMKERALVDIWPHWREFVLVQSEKLKLPKINLPIQPDEDLEFEIDSIEKFNPPKL